MSNREFIEVGHAKVGKAGKSLQLCFRGAYLFISLNRIRGVINGGDKEAPIWIKRKEKRGFEREIMAQKEI